MNESTTNKDRVNRRQRLRTMIVATMGGCLLVATTACSGSLMHNYGSFKSALARGASCSELFDQREWFSDPETLAKVDHDLATIGCTSRHATRND
jgi:hypothetical protein